MLVYFILNIFSSASPHISAFSVQTSAVLCTFVDFFIHNLVNYTEPIATTHLK